MADRALIQGARQMYRAGMYDPAKNEVRKGRFMRAAENVSRAIERQYYDDMRRQEKIKDQEREMSILVANNKLETARVGGDVSNNLTDETKAIFAPHINAATESHNAATAELIKNPNCEDCVEIITQAENRLKNMKQDGTTAEGRRLEDIVGGISNSNEEEKLIIEAVSLAEQKIDDEGNMYYDIDVDNDGVSERITEKEVNKIINTKVNKHLGVAGTQVGAYMLNTIKQAETDGTSPNNVARDITQIVTINSGSNTNIEYENWVLTAFDLDPTLNDNIDMTFVNSKIFEDMQKEYSMEWAEKHGFDYGTASNGDLVVSDPWDMDKDGKTGDIKNSDIPNWVKDKKYAWGEDQKVKKGVTKWLSEGLQKGVDIEVNIHKGKAIKAALALGDTDQSDTWVSRKIFLQAYKADISVIQNLSEEQRGDINNYPKIISGQGDAKGRSRRELVMRTSTDKKTNVKTTRYVPQYVDASGQTKLDIEARAVDINDVEGINQYLGGQSNMEFEYSRYLIN